MSTRILPKLFIIPLAVLLGACGSKDQKGMSGPPPVSVVVQPVQSSVTPYYEEYPAVVRSLNEVELRAQINGYITGIHFKEGEKVKKGQKLYSIDPQQSNAAYKQAQANLTLNEANLQKAKKDLERYRELDKQDAIAKQQLDYAEAAYQAAQQQVEASRAAVQSVQTNVRYSTITAPFDGTIGISQVKLGASISPGQTLLNTISSDNPMAVDIVVDQSEIYRFTQLLNEKKSKTDSTFRLSFKGELYPQSGSISVIDRAVDPQTGTIKMRLVFPNPDLTLRSGMTGTLMVLSNAGSKSLVIPHKAVVEQLGEFFVYLVDSAKVTQRKLVLGKQVGKNVIVKDGLQEGETIVTEGVQNLREGTAITIAEKQPSKN